MKYCHLPLIVILITFIPSFIIGQNYTFSDFDITQNGTSLVNCMDGGLNSPQISQFDLDGDGIKELIIFDKVGDIFNVYKYNNNSGLYEYWLNPPVVFPNINDLALIRDYDGDGVMDIFGIPTDDIVGFGVWKGRKINDQTVLERVQLNKWYYNVLSYPGNNGRLNVYVTITDIPDIQDIDGDGDLDIFSFNEQGSHMVFYKNNSVEQGYGRDSLLFTLEDICYGKFIEGGLDNTITLSSNPNQCATNFTDTTPLELRHSGSTLLVKDIDKDGIQDILLGDISFNNVVFLRNTGTNVKAYITEQNDLFPDIEDPINLGPFPAIYSLDYGPNHEDCIVATSNIGSLATESILNWRYTYDEDAPGNYRLAEKDFLIKNSLDLGLECSPTIYDIDADGKPDLILGNKFYKDKNNGQYGQLVYLRNTSDGNKLSFTVEDEDFANLKSFGINHYGYKPLFTDIDHNGYIDFLIGTERGTLLHFESSTPIGQPTAFVLKSESYQGIKVPSRAAPAAYDFDHDGDTDLIIGDKNGNFCLFINTGTAKNPIFAPGYQDAPNVYRYGNVTVKEIGDTEGDATPFIMRWKGEDILVSGSYNGQIYAFNGMNGTSTTTLSKISLNTESLYSGRQNKPVFGDLNNDGILELIQGNIRGGLNILATDITTSGTISIQGKKSNQKMLLYPIPASAGKRIYFDNRLDLSQLEFISITGKPILKILKSPGQNYLDIPTNTSPGIYILRATFKNRETINSKIIIH